MERGADQDGRAPSIADWLGLGSHPSWTAPRPDEAAPDSSGWRHLTTLAPSALVSPRTTEGLRPSDVLEAWRAAERELAATPGDRLEWTLREAAVSELRALYHQRFEERRGPPPSPADEPHPLAAWFARLVSGQPAGFSLAGPEPAQPAFVKVGMKR